MRLRGDPPVAVVRNLDRGVVGSRQRPALLVLIGHTSGRKNMTDSIEYEHGAGRPGVR